MSEAVREQLVSPPHSIKHILLLIGQLSLPIMEMVPWKWVRGEGVLVVRRPLPLEAFQCFSKKDLALKPTPKMKNKKSQYSSAGLAMLPEPPNHCNYLQFVCFLSKPTIFFQSVANSGKLSGHGRRSRPLWQVNRLCQMEEESKLADTF